MERTATRKRIAAGLAVLLAAVGTVIRAPEHAQSAEDVEDRRGIVITGTKTEHPEEEAPVPTQVIPRERIEATATDNVESLISQIPDIYVRRNEEFSLGASTIRMQGLDPNKVAVVVDGQRFRGGINGVVDLRDIPSIGIEQIEIVRGPASSLYGSDAMAGVINIRTRAGSDELYAEIEGGAGTADKRTIAAATAYHLGPLKYSLSAQHDAVAIADLYPGLSAQYAGENADDLQTRNSVRGRLDYPLADHELRLLGDYLEETNPLSSTEELMGNLGWKWRHRSAWQFDATAGAYSYSRVNQLQGFAEDVDYLDLSGEARVTRAPFTALRADHVATLGLRTRDERLESPATVFGEGNLEAPAIDADAYQISPFVQVESLFGSSLGLVLGLGVDDHEQYGAAVNPRATLTWWPLEGLRVSATSGRGFRAPDLLQLYDIDVNNVAIVGGQATGYGIVGNPNLDPELDFGNTLFVEYTGLRGVRLTADAFRHELDDLIANVLICTGPTTCEEGIENPLPDLDGPIFSFENVSAARTQGVNLAASARPLRWLRRDTPPHDVEVGLGFGYLDSENRSDIAGERGKDLPFRPNLRVLPSVGYSNETYDASLRIWGEYDGRQYSDLANTAAGEVEPYWLWSFKFVQGIGGLASLLGLRSTLWLDTLGFYVQGDNIFDADVNDVLQTAGPSVLVRKRNFMAGLRVAIGD